MKKLTQDFIEKYCQEHGGYNVIGKYEGNHTPLLIEKDGYYDDIYFANFQRGAKPSFFGKRCPYFKKNVQRYIAIHFPMVEFIDVEFHKSHGKKRARTIITMRCQCGNKFTKEWDNLLSNKYCACYKCSRNMASKQRKNGYDNKYYKEMVESGYIPVNSEENFYASVLTEVIERRTGYKGYIYPNRAKNLKKMLIFSTYFNLKNYIYNLNQYAKNNAIKTKALYLTDETPQPNQPLVEFQCVCGNRYRATAMHFINGQTVCSKCSNKYSKYERQVQTFLEQNNISFQKEFKFNSCIDILPLPFDFYLEDYKILIEVDGQQHYTPIQFGGMSLEDAQNQLNLTHKHDVIKTEFCKSHNIPLLRIPYTAFGDDSYKEQILNFIQTVQG